MPCYNCAGTLRRGVESALNQTFADFELLVIDDGSTDNSRELARELSRDPRVVSVPLDRNRGVSAARNHGIEQARGEYLAFLSERDEGKTQVWTLFREGGEGVQLTDALQGVSSFEWAPDSKRLVLVLKDPKPEELEAHEKGEEYEEKTTPPWVVTRQQFKQDYVGYLDSRRDHLYVFDLATKETTQITSPPMPFSRA